MGAQILTQGFNIELPFEQKVSPAIEEAMELVHFPTRKLMLYENALGVVIFPGGFGTLDELFEIWRLRVAKRLRDPFVLYGSAFWAPILEALARSSAGSHGSTIAPDVLGMARIVDDPDAALDVILGGDPVRGAFDEPPLELGTRIARELIEGLDYLESLAPAVTVLGGSRLPDGGRAVTAAAGIAERLARAGIPTRAAGPGALSIALAQGGHRGSRFLPQQAFGMRDDDPRQVYGADRVHLVNDRLTHKVLLTERSLGWIAFPGGLGTLDELFSVLCQVQTGKIPRHPAVLFGSDFWQPLVDVIRRQMLDGQRRMISEEDLELVRVTDDLDEAAALAVA